MTKKSKQLAVITVIGKDKVGIVAKITNFLAKNSINIEEISQNVMRGIFTMVLLVDLEKSSLSISELSKKLEKTGKQIGMDVHVHDENIIRAMHRV
ncbi:MAG: ACT domain-containing protein [Candidatus Moranbacteria bacterium]|nr:ACT domain-containing protein [Candidatus Moranbacteria bacterium]